MTTDPEEAWERDKQKAKQAIEQYQQQGGGFWPSTATLIEYSLWTLAIGASLGMVVIMPWVGSDGLITGEQWLGLGLPFIALLGGSAYVVRKLPTEG